MAESAVQKKQSRTYDARFDDKDIYVLHVDISTAKKNISVHRYSRFIHMYLIIVHVYTQLDDGSQNFKIMNVHN